MKSLPFGKRGEKLGPANPVATPPGIDGLGCQIIYGHNEGIKKVMMQFSVTADRLIFTPEEARDVAKQLLLRADMAEGKKTQG
jgi:hypothetical protein